jgi:cyclopropane fatty-acyl-phospholipid synthase-like methyltransferase
MSPETQTSVAAERNKDPILDVLKRVLPARGHVLEIASGFGQHVCHFAQALPNLYWQPTEYEADRIQAIEARIRAAGLANIAPPLVLDVLTARWDVEGPFDAVVCINMIHASPAATTPALLSGSAQLLKRGAPLVLYGAYLENGTAAPSNLEFDAWLKKKGPDWGLRDLDDVTALAAQHGFERSEIVRMPANNLTVVFRKV